MYRYQVMVDEDCKKMLDAVPAYYRSEFVRNVMKEHRLKQADIPKSEPKVPSLSEKREKLRLIKID